MQIDQLATNNFNCFEDIEFNLYPQGAVFIDENASGWTFAVPEIAKRLN